MLDLFFAILVIYFFVELNDRSRYVNQQIDEKYEEVYE
jgi:hypothetical protein